jgi:hypothetical protein
LKNVNSCVTIELKRPIAPRRFVATTTRDLSLGAGFNPLPPKKSFLRCKTLQSLAFWVIDFEAEAVAGSNLTGSGL